MTSKTLWFGLLAAAICSVALIFPTSGLAKDRNEDKIPDRWEKRFGLSLKVKQTKKDPDGDGVNNLNEFRSGTKPGASDSDHDGVADDDEDRDRDRVDNGNEQVQKTHPGKKDSDGDSKPDGKEDRDRDGLNNAGEDATGNIPVDPDSDDDQALDGEENAAVISAYDAETGALELTLFAGGTISGRVDAETRLRCRSEEQHECGDDDEIESRHGGDSEEDNSGPGNARDRCPADALSVGRVVHEAELRLQGGELWFKKISIVIEESEATP